ncbi:MAG: polysaccharide deacetylase family protein [Anaerolineae bacterium]|nr:polysaccharide deacetylase family protein [Anaerolineae bacterium]
MRHPEAFEEQIDWVSKHFNVIDLATLHAHIVDEKALPERALLITFDDGYMDNYTNALPVLKKYGLPAVIFIVTGSMDNPSPLWWDICSESFRQTTKTQATLPLIGEQIIATAKLKYSVERQMIGALKRVAEHEKQANVEDLQRVLDVTLPNTQMFFGWEQVQELVANGIACQPHTVTHPILTRIPEDEMRRQVADSRQQVIERSGQEVLAFAYPNGSTADYSLSAMQALSDSGYDMAFTLVSGPMPVKDIRQHPYQIKRVYLSRRDSMAIFQMKVLGVPALLERGKYL